MKKASIERKRVIHPEETILNYISSDHSLSSVPIDCWKFIFNCGSISEFSGLQLSSKWLLALFWDCVTNIDIKTKSNQYVLYCLSNCNVQIVTSVTIFLPTLTNPILKQLGRLQELRNLKIHGNIQSIDNFKHLSNLKTLTINGRFPKPFLQMCCGLTHLEKLNIYSSNLKDEDMLYLLPLYGKIEEIDVGLDPVNIFKLNKVHSLRVSLEYLEYLKYFPRLSILKVQATNKYKCDNQLMKLAELKSLESLTITHWDVSKIIIDELIESLPHLEMINLMNCRNVNKITIEHDRVMISMPYSEYEKREERSKPKIQYRKTHF